MKKPISALVIILVAVVTYGEVLSHMAQSSVQAATSSVKLYVNPTSLSITAGQTGSVQLRLSKDSSAKVDYVDAKATFSTANLEVVSISRQGSHFGYSNGPATSFNNSNGTLAISGRGAELATKADVLVATVTFRGKSVGTGSISYTASSQAGDLTNGGHVKNSLSARVGGIVDISSPPPADSGSGISGGGTAPSTPPSSSPDAQEQATEEAASPDAPTSNEAPTGTTGDQDKNVPASGVTATLEEAVTKPPVWMQYLVPGAAVVGVTGIASLGWVLQRKRRKDGVHLPPSDESAGGITMPSTEQAEEATELGFGIGITASPDAAADSFAPVEEPDLPEFSALHAMAPVAAPEVVDRMPLESALEQEPVLMPPELMNVPSPELEVPAAPLAAEPEIISPPDLAVAAAPSLEAAPLPPAEQVVADEPVSPADMPMPPTPPQMDMAAPQPVESAPEVSPLPQPPVVPVEPLPMPQTAEAAPASPPAPVPELPVAPVVVGQTTAAAQLSQTDNVDYANMPDMFDVGAERLQNEGLSNLGPVQR